MSGGMSGGWVPQFGSGTLCPAPMTRGALLALRATGGLTKDCDYVVTDHVQGRLVAGTTVHLQAIDASTLATEAQVKTTYDNVAWAGRYDIDVGLVYELTDNRNNRVLGAGAVGAFDWGNTAYTDCTVEHATWNVTIGSARPMQRVRVLDGSTLTTVGMVGGSLTDVRVERGSTANLTGANLSLLRCTYDQASTFAASGYTGGGTHTGVTVSGTSTLNISGTTTVVALTNCRFDTGGSFTHAGVTTGSTTLNQVVVDNSGALSKATGAQATLMNGVRITGYASVQHASTGALTANYSTVSDNAVVSTSGAAASLTLTGTEVRGNASAISHTAGAIVALGSRIGPYGRVLKNAAASTGTLTLNYCAIESAGYVQHLGAGPLSMTGTEVRGASYVTSSAAANTAAGMTVNHSALGSGSYISHSAVAGAMSVQNTQLLAGGLITKTGAGALAVSSSMLAGSGHVQQNGVRGLSVVGSMMTNVGRVIAGAAGGAGVQDQVLYSSVQDYAIVQFNATGAAANAVNYSSARGNTANVTFSGTNTGTSVSRLTVDNGNVSFSNNTAAFPNIIDVGVRDQGSLNVSGCSAAQDIRYSTVQSYSRLNITNKTAAARAYGINCSALGTFTTQGAAGDALYVDVRHGTLNHNGGTLTTAAKSMAGTLTTGAFNHSNIQHHANATKTLTAANTNRADYQGLAAQLV